MTTQTEFTRAANEHAFCDFPGDWESITAMAEASNDGAPVSLVIQNGSRWGGQEPATIAELLDVLGREPLDLTFCRYGGFIECCPVSSTTRKPMFPEGFYQFHGNFLNVSHAFSIVTNDPATKSALECAIKKNLSRQQAAKF